MHNKNMGENTEREKKKEGFEIKWIEGVPSQ